MPNIVSKTSRQLMTLLAGVLIFKVTVSVILNYRNYFPPNFGSDFLRGREGYYAAAGPIAAIGLAMLAVMTGTCIALGWRSAVQRRFSDHRRWMWRTFLLLCSAVVLRLIGGLATVTGLAATWLDPISTWMSWLVPLAVFEWSELARRQTRRSLAQSALNSRRR